MALLRLSVSESRGERVIQDTKRKKECYIQLNMIRGFVNSSSKRVHYKVVYLPRKASIGWRLRLGRLMVTPLKEPYFVVTVRGLNLLSPADEKNGPSPVDPLK